MAWHMLTVMEGRQRERERERYTYVQCAHGPSVCGRPLLFMRKTRKSFQPKAASPQIRVCENVMHLRTCTVALGPMRRIVLFCSRQIFVHILPQACSSLLEYIFKSY